MIVECLGIPGAGKSTVASLLVKDFGFIEIPKQVSKKYWIKFSLLHPFFVCTWCYLLLKEGLSVWSLPLSRFKLAVFLNTLGRIQYAQMHYAEEDFVILDEGLIQRVFSLFESPKLPKAYDALLKNIPVTHVVIQIEYRGVAFTESRVGTYRRTKGEEYISKWRSVMAQNFQSLSESLSRSKFEKIMYVRGDTDDNNVLAVVARAIKKTPANIV